MQAFQKPVIPGCNKLQYINVHHAPGLGVYLVSQDKTKVVLSVCDHSGVHTIGENAITDGEMVSCSVLHGGCVFYAVRPAFRDYSTSTVHKVKLNEAGLRKAAGKPETCAVIKQGVTSMCSFNQTTLLLGCRSSKSISVLQLSTVGQPTASDAIGADYCVHGCETTELDDNNIFSICVTPTGAVITTGEDDQTIACHTEPQRHALWAHVMPTSLTAVWTTDSGIMAIGLNAVYLIDPASGEWVETPLFTYDAVYNPTPNPALFPVDPTPDEYYMVPTLTEAGAAVGCVARPPSTPHPESGKAISQPVAVRVVGADGPTLAEVGVSTRQDVSYVVMEGKAAVTVEANGVVRMWNPVARNEAARRRDVPF